MAQHFGDLICLVVVWRVVDPTMVALLQKASLCYWTRTGLCLQFAKFIHAGFVFNTRPPYCGSIGSCRHYCHHISSTFPGT